MQSQQTKTSVHQDQPMLAPVRLSKLKPSPPSKSTSNESTIRWHPHDPSVFYTISRDPYAPIETAKPYEIVNVMAPNLFGVPIPKWPRLYT